MKRTVYAVEDDAAIRELYEYCLESEFTCRCFEDGKALFRALGEALPDIILLDVMLPGEDGLSLLSRLKHSGSASGVPVIMVSAKGDEVSKVKGLDMGADDYIAKPFGVMELIARIKANLRKSGPAAGSEGIAYKDVAIDYSRHSIAVRGEQLRITLKEHNLLCMLVENAQKVLRRESIFFEVWGEGFMGETRTLDIHIKQLRKKLAEAGSEASIQTIRGVGYMLA